MEQRHLRRRPTAPRQPVKRLRQNNEDAEADEQTGDKGTDKWVGRAARGALAHEQQPGHQ